MSALESDCWISICSLCRDVHPGIDWRAADLTKSSVECPWERDTALAVVFTNVLILIVASV